MAAYTDAAKIAAHLGVALTSAQQAQADVVATAITTWIDHRTGRTWQGVTGSVADEVHSVTGGAVWLNYAPVTAVSAVDVRAAATDGWESLAASSYGLADPATGKVSLPGTPDGYDARVDYSHTSATPPADLGYAATVLASEVLYTALHPESAGIDSISVAQNDITLRYASASADGAGRTSGAELAIRIVDAYRKVVLA